jgi:hypothetical protein
MGWSVRVRIPAGARDFSLLKTSDKLWSPPSLLFNGCLRSLPRGGGGEAEWLQHDVYHSACLALRLRISGAIHLTSPYCLHGMDRDIFTITVCFGVKCLRNLIPKDSGMLLKFYDCPPLFQTTG